MFPCVNELCTSYARAYWEQSRPLSSRLTSYGASRYMQQDPHPPPPLIHVYDCSVVHTNHLLSSTTRRGARLCAKTRSSFWLLRHLNTELLKLSGEAAGLYIRAISWFSGKVVQLSSWAASAAVNCWKACFQWFRLSSRRGPGVIRSACTSAVLESRLLPVYHQVAWETGSQLIKQIKVNYSVFSAVIFSVILFLLVNWLNFLHFLLQLQLFCYFGSLFS